MVTSVTIGLGILATVASALYLRYERKQLEHLLASDDLYIYIYLEPEATDAPALDVYSDEVLSKKINAQWN